ncbi:uncharacterized protein MYCFIDRAFT_179948 [Pseudocercospora fijiensis CIRAD86]|uniref:Uncharacterized protein n=1 Tax=Pseudocercospora fijiensis (strain CIRAD86) TaxID=383855 RepID=M3AIT3_PSEFD|nr:uncharacterized protein MYCFIDRAFT_179948 [Pseudocercospora fijiensis CIRAD86]EME77377.1 hypothetical protein MYCFIDRAFT_179948 [Pseudocercospora fijiensis CIRAD86]
MSLLIACGVQLSRSLGEVLRNKVAASASSAFGSQIFNRAPTCALLISPSPSLRRLTVARGTVQIDTTPDEWKTIANATTTPPHQVKPELASNTTTRLRPAANYSMRHP